MNSNGNEAKKRRFGPLKPQRLLEEVHKQLKEAILEGRYKPGDRLPSEQEFCKMFGVGRPVIREAFRFLENSGLIMVKAGARGGAFVQKIDASVLFNTFEGIVKLDGISKDELHEARVAFELAALPLVMRRITKEDIKALEDNLREVRENVEKNIRGKRNITFHVLLFKASRNQLLIKIGEALFELMERILDKYEYSEKRSRTFLEEHTALVELLKAGKMKKARLSIENHIRDSITHFH
ncbi:MAG TPA: FCD domain-containing protein [Syntrophorhabdaceae bacterium]|nr:FCD domain-containing protein [Syntrophorhabdaceae bacterium]